MWVKDFPQLYPVQRFSPGFILGTVSIYRPTPCTHSFTRSVFQQVYLCACDMPGIWQCWRHGHGRAVGYGPLCFWVDTSGNWLWKEKEFRGGKWRGVWVSALWEFLVARSSFAVTLAFTNEASDLSCPHGVWEKSQAALQAQGLVPGFCFSGRWSFSQ